MKYKLIIFDFDGTIADTFPWFLTIAEHVIQRYRLPDMELSDPESFKLMGTSNVMKAYGIPLWKAAIMARYVKKRMNEDIQNIPLFQNIDALLHDIHRSGMKLALVSSNNYQNVQQVLGEELAALFECYECGVSLFGKTRKFKKVVKQCGVLENETLCIGDEIRDVQAAKKAGIPFGAVSWGYSHITALQEHHSGLIFRTVEDIYEAIFRQPVRYNQMGLENADAAGG